ncbi:AAA domain-containing protein [Burkholderia ubonensis]|uniref:AAA domain-containing protein n=1 Tax=Burkholderia ubonensis TaxID=101571 RepID=UPI0012F80C2D|nr:AAA domain-containing protein [Burkholderia ubonensis]
MIAPEKIMNNTVSQYLGYVQASLADGSRLMPDLTDDMRVEVCCSTLMDGNVDQHHTSKLYAAAKQRAARRVNQSAKVAGDDEDDEMTAIPVLVCPRVFGLRTEHGRSNDRLPLRIAPVVIAARLNRKGELIGDDRTSAAVLIPRNLLEPTPWDVAIGTVDAADAAYAKRDVAPGTWGALVAQADLLLNELTGETLDVLTIAGYEPLEVGVVLMRGPGKATQQIESLVDRLRSPDSPALPLVDALLREASAAELLTPREQLARSAAHLGQMECRYGLADSQRESLMHHLSDAAPAVLAVDGPPGTGKTTLLLSAIATAWVDAALRDGEPPVIVAASTNNQAVLNILRAFAEVVDSPGPFAGRWLRGLESYGLFLPSKSKEIQENFPVHAMRGKGRDATYDARAYETQDGLAAARATFLEHAKHAFPDEPDLSPKRVAALVKEKMSDCAARVKAVVDALLRLNDVADGAPMTTASVTTLQARADSVLTDGEVASAAATERVNGLLEIRRRWTRHCADERWWVSLLVVLRIGGTLRRQRDAAYWAETEGTSYALVGATFRRLTRRADIDAALADLVDAAEQARADADAAVGRAKQFKDGVDAAVDVVRGVVGQSGELTPQAAQVALDMGPRYSAFKLATHYWEARYLIEVDEQLSRAGTMDDNRAPEKMLRQYRRLAKLHPCFVATLYTLPYRFTGYLGEEKPLYDAIDLLIVDEAGQVAPEIGVPSFALARRALIVGDVDQIKPIWSVPQAVDLVNVLRHGVASDAAAQAAFHQSGLAASAGSLMQVAQRATPYSKHPQRGRGMFLSEHRRCWPEIIAMCNRLSYQGLLLPRRNEGPRRMVPSVGYVHLPGVAIRNGTSRSNSVEAAAIAKWLALRRGEIESAFASDGKKFGQLVAVVTPFSAQARVVRRALDDALGRHHGVTVGTIHALQGAERRVVIFSPTYGLGTSPGTTFFDTDPSILNVAISRAQDAFLIFGNMHLFRPAGSHPSAIVGSMLFTGGNNEIADVPTECLVPGYDLAPAALIRDLDAHRAVLAEAFETARTRLVIVSPFLARPAIEADGIPERIAAAKRRGVRVTVVSDPGLNQRDPAAYQHCLDRLRAAGATIRTAESQGVHSKLVLVDYAWLVVGSFNWLSAVRGEASDYARYESSLRYDGHEAFQMIGRTLRDLRGIVGSVPDAHCQPE